MSRTHVAKAMPVLVVAVLLASSATPTADTRPGAVTRAAATDGGGSGPLQSGGAVGDAERVGANGSYHTSVTIPVPPAPGAPAVSLEYDSGSAGGVAGVGWDLSVGWPTTIARDTRFGTPAWKFTDAWVWGAAPLVPDTNCAGNGTPCQYRTAPDFLVQVKIDLTVTATTSPSAQVRLPTGTTLTYTPVHYDGSAYPSAPPGAETDVFAFLLKEVRDRNGHTTCLSHKHFGGAKGGRVAALEEIGYGTNCTLHKVRFSYDETTPKYFTQWSLRLGARATFSNLLTSAVVIAGGKPQSTFTMGYEVSAETRRPLLIAVKQQADVPGAMTEPRVIGDFSYGSRKEEFGDPKLVDLGPDAEQFPPSLSGGVTRPVRSANVLKFLSADPLKYALIDGGFDQTDQNAPVSNATTEQWNWNDHDGDGLPDQSWSRETGMPAGNGWTFEHLPPAVQRPPQQLVDINEGLAGDRMLSTRTTIDAQAPDLSNPATGGYAGSGLDGWIWGEGQGQTRTGMPVSISTPEISDSIPWDPAVGVCPLLSLAGDTRHWPQHPDGSRGGSQGSTGEAVSAALWLPTSNLTPAKLAGTFKGVHDAYVPHDTVSATVSGWLDVDGDGKPEFVATPSMIHQFAAGCPIDPKPATSVKTAKLDNGWHVGSPKPAGGGLEVRAARTSGPGGPVGLPLDYTISSGAAQGFGFTVPLGSSSSAFMQAGAGAGSGLAWAEAAPGLIAAHLTPRATSGVSAYSPSSSSATGALLELAAAVKNNTLGKTVGSKFTPSIDWLAGLDLNLIATESWGRTQNRAQVMDVNADGLVDYLLYDSTGRTAVGGQPGDLVVFLNEGGGTYGKPQRINAAAGGQSDYLARPDLTSTAGVDTNAKTASEILLRLLGELDILCKKGVTAANISTIAACTIPVGVEVANLSATARAVATSADKLLSSSPDALPADRYRIDELRTAANLLDAAMIVFIAAAGVFFTTPAIDHPADVLFEMAQFVEQMTLLTGRTVHQLDYRSRINMISKGLSSVDRAAIGEVADGVSVETIGFVELNGDGLPDYVITSDRENLCPVGQWAVYWGTGTAQLESGRAFTPAHACVTVPAVPPDLQGSVDTMPLRADMSRRAKGTFDVPFMTPTVVDTVEDSYVSLQDWNEDGFVDLLVAGFDRATNTYRPWDPYGAGRQWGVFLNNGMTNGPNSMPGFETKPLIIDNPGRVPSHVHPAWSGPAGSMCEPTASLTLVALYPSQRSTHVETPTLADQANPAVRARSRDVTCVHSGSLDIDGDGTSEMVRRMRYCPATSKPCATEHAGLLVWSRAGDAPQDVLTSERYPMEGSQIKAEYRPATSFQWPDAAPTGEPPADGHRPLAGSGSWLVRSVTVERMLGRPDREATRTGYDYRIPAFDTTTRLPAGYALRSRTPQDPVTGAPLAAGLVTYQRDAQRPHGVGALTHTRTVEQAGGAPVHETLTSFLENPAPGRGRGGLAAVHSTPTGTFDVEYPEGLRYGPVLDLGLDGREPFTDRAGHRDATFPSSARPSPDAGKPTGGAVGFNQAMPSPLSYPSPHQGLVPAATVETWIDADGAGARTIVDQPGGYRLSVTLNGKIRFEVATAGAGTASVEAALPSGWAHVSASFGPHGLLLAVNGRSTAAAGTAVAVAAGPLLVGCTDAGGGPTVKDCFAGDIGELRIYPEAWPGPARVSGSERTVHDKRTEPHQFGQAANETQHYDLATDSDDVTTEWRYATNQGVYLVGAASSEVRRVPSGKVLARSEHLYDGKAILGELGRGNETERRDYPDPAVSDNPGKAERQLTSYHPAPCLGSPASATDPEGNTTTTEWDTSCTFALKITNPLGHVSAADFFGVNGFVPAKGFVGLYGQPARTTDPNGATTRWGYDEWGRVTATLAPLDSRPVRTAYRDAQCLTPFGDIACTDPHASLASPPRIETTTWDDQTYHQRTDYVFGDGQTQTETIKDGKPDWTISGIRDLDQQGRVTRSYKARYRSEVGDGGEGEPCPPSGEWCVVWSPSGDTDTSGLRRKVATVQTAYDARSRVIRTYGPGWHRCAGDPSDLDATGGVACDSHKATMTDVTTSEYLAPGVSRVIGPRGVPLVTRTDVRDLVSAVEEYEKAAPTVYSRVSSEYDRLGRQVNTTDQSNNVSAATYDGIGRIVGTDDPDLGVATIKHDRRGLVTEEINATGDKAVHRYDELGRIGHSEYLKPHPGLVESEPKELQVVETKNLGWLAEQRPQQRFDESSGFNPKLDGPRPAMKTLGLAVGNLDDGVATVPLPFDVVLTPTKLWTTQDQAGNLLPAEGRNVFTAGSPMHINTNGKIRFDNPGRADTMPPPTTRTATQALAEPPPRREAALYPYWSDLVLDHDGLAFGVIGEAPDRQLTVEWKGRQRTSPDSRVHLQTVVLERTAEIQYRYLDVPTEGDAVVGAQNFSPQTGETTRIPAASPDGTPRRPTTGTLLTFTSDTGAGPILAMSQPSDTAEPASAVYRAVLTRAQQATLQIRHRWLTRCAATRDGQCDVDRMTIGYRDPDNPDLIRPLIGSDTLADKAYLEHADSPAPSTDSINVDLPRALLGRSVDIVVGYDPVERSRDGKMINFALHGMHVVTTEYEPEEIVYHHYDSAAQPADYAPSKPILDIPFDVPDLPGVFRDRTPGQTKPTNATASGFTAVPGASGGAIELNNETVTFDLDPTGHPLFHLTAEAWIRPNPISPPLKPRDQDLLTLGGTFKLTRTASGQLACNLTASAINPTPATNTTVADDVWTHVAMTYDGQQLRCFVNGEPITVPLSGSVIIPAKPKPQLLVGSATYQGGVDEVRVFSTARTPDQVRTDALTPLRGGPPGGDLIDLHLADGSNLGADSSASTNHANPPTGADVTTGPMGAAVQMAGAGLIQVDHSPRLNFANQVTTEAWIKTTATGPAQITGKWGGVQPGWRLGIFPGTNKLLWEVRTTIPGPNGSPPKTGYGGFVTFETIDKAGENNGWHHVAATYDGARMRVFIDGEPAHRDCELTGGDPGERDILLSPHPKFCADPPVIADRCPGEVITTDDGIRRPDTACVIGSINNTLPVKAGSAGAGQAGLHGGLDEIRVSNYAKRPFEVAASARTAADATRMLGREDELRNELPIGTQISRERRAYDQRGRPVTILKDVHGQRLTTPFTTRAAFDNVDRTGSREYPTGEVTVNGFDLAGTQHRLVGYGQLHSINPATPFTHVYLDNATANITGMLKAETFGNGATNTFEYADGPTTSGAFGNEHLAKQTTAAAGGTPLSTREYDWDPGGNLLERRRLATPGQPALTSTYTYDDIDRIKTATFKTSSVTQPTRAYSYDELGNLTAKDGATQSYGRARSPAGCGAGTTTLPHAITERILSGTTKYCYDQAGRLVQRRPPTGTARALSYFARGGLARVEAGSATSAFLYDGVGARVSKTEQGAATIEPFPFYRELPGGGTESLYSANGRAIARRSSLSSSDVSWYHPDHLGGTNIMTDHAGQEITSTRTEHLPFGEYLPGNAPSSDHAGGRQFTGKELDKTGLYYYGARYYDPEIGRFTEADTIIPGTAPQAYNRYSYTLNNPGRYIDPNGRASASAENAMNLVMGSAYGLFNHVRRQASGAIISDYMLSVAGAKDPVLAALAPLDFPTVFLEQFISFDQHLDAGLTKLADGDHFGAGEDLTGAMIDAGGAIVGGAQAARSISKTSPLKEAHVIGPSPVKKTAPPPTVQPIQPGQTVMQHGTQVHQSLPAIVDQTNPGAMGTFNVAPGLTGPDFVPQSGANFTYGEMKSMWGRQAPMLQQGQNWGFDPQTARYFFYDRVTGYVGEGIIQTEKVGSSGRFR